MNLCRRSLWLPWLRPRPPGREGWASASQASSSGTRPRGRFSTSPTPSVLPPVKNPHQMSLATFLAYRLARPRSDADLLLVAPPDPDTPASAVEQLPRLLSLAHQDQDASVSSALAALEPHWPHLDLDQCVRVMRMLSSASKTTQAARLLSRPHWRRCSRALDATCAQHLERDFRPGRIQADPPSVAAYLHLAYLAMDNLHWHGPFFTKLTFLFLSPRMLSSLDRSETVFLLFLAGLQRRLAHASRQADAIPDHLADQLVRILPSSSLEESGTVAHALYMLQRRLQTHNERDLTPLFFRALLAPPNVVGGDDDVDMNAKFSTLSPAVGSLCKFLLIRGSMNWHEMEEVQVKYRPLLHRLDFHAISRLLALVINSRLENSGPFVEEAVQALRKEIPNGRLIKDWEGMCKWLSVFNYPRQSAIYWELLGQLSRPGHRADPRSNHRFLLMAKWLALAGCYDNEVLEEIFAKANAFPAFHKMAASSAADRTRHQDVARAAVDFVFSLTPSSTSIMRDKEQEDKWKQKEMERSHMKYMKSLVAVAELDCFVDLDWTGYKGTRLDPELRRAFLGFRPLDQPGSFGENLRLQLRAELRDLVGFDVLYEYTLPHASSKDLLVCWDHKLGKPVFRENFLSGQPKDRIVRPPRDEDGSTSWLAIIVPKKSQLDSGGSLTGIMEHRRYLLKKLGYRVAVARYKKYKRDETSMWDWLQESVLADEETRPSG